MNFIPKNYKLILASASPRRREILQLAGFEFEVKADFLTDESYPQDMDVEQVPLHIAMQKAQSYPLPLQSSEILITADTVVVHNNKIYGKPFDATHAQQMLQELQDSWHTVITAVVIKFSSGEMVSFTDETKVHFKPLTISEIQYYIENYQPFDKAAAYGIQEWIGAVAVDSIQGSYYNVMGFPIHRFIEELKIMVNKIQF